MAMDDFAPINWWHHLDKSILLGANSDWYRWRMVSIQVPIGLVQIITKGAKLIASNQAPKFVSLPKMTMIDTFAVWNIFVSFGE